MSYNQSAAVGLHWTGHPLVDMGVAGLTVFARKRRPEEVTGADLEEFILWAADMYLTPELKSWISVVFTSNFPTAVQQTGSEERRKLIIDFLSSFKMEQSFADTNCTFFNRKAQLLASRELVPMLTGREPMNFFPDGKARLPVSGLAITALQGLSVASPLVEGRAMVIAPDDQRLLIPLVQRWQAEIRTRAQFSQTSGEKCLGWTSPRSRLVEQLVEIERLRERNDTFKGSFSGGVTVYHISNSGQGPGITIYTLEIPVIGFIRKAQGINYRESWNHMIHGNWNDASKKDKDPIYGRRNRVYEALFSLPQDSAVFIHSYFFKILRDQLKEENLPRTKKQSQRGSGEEVSPEPVSYAVPLWGLLELFLREVLGMEQSRIQAIRSLGNRLAGAVKDENDRRLFRRIYSARKPFEVRQLLIQIGMRHLKTGLEPAVGFEEYLTIFEEGDELARADFGLAWDLTRIRVIEALFEAKWFDVNREVLEEIADEDMGGN